MSTSFSATYELKQELGKGAFSIVKKCTHRTTGEDYAVKIINKRRLTARDVQKLEKEERICRKLQHTNIVTLHESIAEEVSHYLIFDLVTGGELFDEVVAREYYSESDASLCMQQVLEGVNYCHKKSVLHRDLKPENLLLSSKAKDARLKLADFGLAIELEDSQAPAWYGFAGTPGYLSPEVLRREPYHKPIDMWACGVILYILLVGYPPFWDEDQKRLYAQIKSARFDFPSPEWDTVTDAGKDLIRRMLNPDTKTRITADEALRDPWISQRQRVASTLHRQDTIAGLKKFNARRKLKGAILTTMIATRSKLNLFRNRVSESDLLQTPVDSPPANPLTAAVPEEPLSGVVPVQDPSTLSAEVLACTQRLLAAVRLRDYDTYKQLCDPSLVSFCPEASAQMLVGLDFYQFALSNVSPNSAENVTLVNPQVRMLGDSAACICYVRLNQIVDKSGLARTEECKETRVWSKGEDGSWRCMHVHTS